MTDVAIETVLRDLTAEVRNLQHRTVKLEEMVTPEGQEEATTSEPAGSDEPFMFTNAADFAEQWLLDHIDRRASTGGTGEIAWCAKWWRHPEAALRVEALWRSFEAARLDPFNVIAAWILNQLDPQVAMLTSRRGPLGRCTPKRCAGHSRLDSAPVPDGHPLGG